MGVLLALQKLDALVENRETKGPIYTLGPIIHNPQVLGEYTSQGVITAESAEDIPAGATAVIRAHGIPKHMEKDLLKRGVRIIDATCPKVKKAQILIEKQTRESRMLLLYGEESHPEVKGLLSYAASGAFLFDSREKLNEFPFLPDEKYCLAAQTTQDKKIFDAIVEELSSRQDRDVTILQTICDATRQRQEEAVQIAREVDFMVVAGGFNSGNTRRLAQVVAAQNTACVHVEQAKELPLETLKGHAVIGLTAGASTPDKIIDEIHEILKKLS